MVTRRVVVTIAFALWILAGAQAQGEAQYAVVSLGPGVVALDINNEPQVVGYAVDSGQLLMWDWRGRHTLGVHIDSSAGLRINDHGIIAGVRVVDGQRRLFALVNGGVYDLPALPGDAAGELRSLTNINTLLVQGERASWLFAGGTWTDLTALTGAEIRALNQTGTMAGATSAGTLQVRPYLRDPAGHVVVPWTEPASIALLGPGGHFASTALGVGTVPYWWFATPESTPTRVGELSVFLRSFHPLDINSAGDVVGYGDWRRLNPLEPWYAVGFLRRQGRTEWLPLERAVAINDAGYILGSDATGPVVLVPTPFAPMGLIGSVADGVVTLSWQAVAGAIEYIVEAGSRGGAADLYNAAVGAQPMLVTAAPPGRYYVRVRARTGAGVSAPSQEVVIDVP